VRNREPQSQATKWIDSAIIACLFLLAAFAPHSIAVTQTAWLLGMLLWVARFAFYPPPRIWRTPIDYPLLGFFILTGLSTFLSYEPLISAGKLRAASLFTIVYLVSQSIPLRIVRLLALTLVVSCMINVLFVIGQTILGRGIRLEGVNIESPLSRAMTTPRTIAKPVPIVSGDIVFEVDGHKINDPEDLSLALAAAPGHPTAKVKIYRIEWTPTLEVPRGRLLPGATAEEQLGISGWSRGRAWRATGFFGHWVTYAESLQLIASLALGLFLACPEKRCWRGLLLLVAVAGLIVALVLTVTRASWLAFLISAGLMLLLSSSKRTVLIVGACVIPLVIGGLLFLKQKRSIRFYDPTDQSTTWRETVWREGFHLLVSNPRHLLVGVGMDSLKAHWREWGLFDNGKIPPGHMHSNLLQIALERGIPALLVWLWLLGTYAWMLLRLVRSPNVARSEIGNRDGSDAWIDRGIVLGALGGLAGFFVSGLAHYNWGDSEVVMILYLIMGLTLVIQREYSGTKTTDAK
jgi:hypothetical protein